MAQQTAVEWYAKEHHKLLIQLENKELSLGAYVVKHSDILKQSKQMEKEQIVQAYQTADQYVWKSTRKETAEQYYNETFGNK